MAENERGLTAQNAGEIEAEMSNPLDNRFSDLNKQGFMKQRARKIQPVPIFHNGYLIEKTSGGYDLLHYHGASPLGFFETVRLAERAADSLPFNR